MTDPSHPRGSQEKYKVKRSTVLLDRFMNKAIAVSGAGVIGAVLLILIFIFIEVRPLLTGAEVRKESEVALPVKSWQAMALDEWGELPGLIQGGGIDFVTAGTGQLAKRHEFPAEAALLAYRQDAEELAGLTKDGQFWVSSVNYRRELDEAGQPKAPEVDVKDTELYDFPVSGEPLVLGYGANKETRLVAAIVESGGKRQVHAVSLEQKVDLFGNASALAPGSEWDIGPLLPAPARDLVVSKLGDNLLVVCEDGQVCYLHLQAEEDPVLVQTFRPFKDASPVALDFMFGDMSIVAVAGDGRSCGWSLAKPDQNAPRLFVPTKTFSEVKGAMEVRRSVRNKVFGVQAADRFTFFNYTSEQERTRIPLPAGTRSVAFTSKYHRILVAGESGLVRWSLNDPHPESSWGTFFGKVHYEGGLEPEYAWQSGGGSDEVESKLSMIPLIFGSLKTCFWGLLFAVPLALAAAVYTALFMRPEVRTVIKPAMEVMASLPSVVIGFVSALWLAPRIENCFPNLLAVMVAVPLISLIFGWMQSRLPYGHRFKSPAGQEFLWIVPALALICYGAWHLGPVIDSVFFTVTDAKTGKVISNFAGWWASDANGATAHTFTQRNALIVGFAIGFAVIPIIYTLADDALINVPSALSSASLALGASRWQTAWNIVLPAASGGLFSAIMIGMGRAVGETIIVLCAAGGTAILEWNLFAGMRPLSLNLATELPEAAVGGTLYRALFLGALILFLMTFVVNTIAEILRQHLRKKYKAL